MQPRPYTNDEDLGRMCALLDAGFKSHGNTFYIHPGDLHWWTYYLDSDEEPDRRIILWEEGQTGGELAGWSYFSTRYKSFDLFAHPSRLMNPDYEFMLMETIREAQRRYSSGTNSWMQTIWVSEFDRKLVSTLEKQGFTRQEFHFLHMQRTLDDAVTDLSLPEGFGFRHVYGEQDLIDRSAAAYAAFGSSRPFQSYRENYLRFMRSPAYESRNDLVIVSPTGRIASFCICWLDNQSNVGLFEPVGTHPEFQQRGLGKVILQEGMRHMKDMGMTTAIVSVESDNPGAQSLYRSMGFKPDQKLFTYKITLT